MMREFTWISLMLGDPRFYALIELLIFFHRLHCGEETIINFDKEIRNNSRMSHLDSLYVAGIQDFIV